jgi:hypothetical protein
MGSTAKAMIARRRGQVKDNLHLVDALRRSDNIAVVLRKGGREVEGVPLETGYPPEGGS